MEKLRYCRMCLIYKEADQNYTEKISKYLASIEDDVRVSKEVYEQRLKICANCEKLMNGVCRACGCFVEIRAAVANNYCPHVEKKW